MKTKALTQREEILRDALKHVVNYIERVEPTMETHIMRNIQRDASLAMKQADKVKDEPDKADIEKLKVIIDDIERVSSGWKLGLQIFDDFTKFKWMAEKLEKYMRIT